MVQSHFEPKLKAMIFNFLSKQTYLQALPNHGYQILLSFCFFTIISWASYYAISPKLLACTKKKKVKNDEYARLKWGHMFASFIHAIVVCPWSFYLGYDGSISTTVDSRVFGYSPSFGALSAFSCGYFAWDIFCSVWHVKQYGKGFIVHALLGFSTLIFCYKPFTIYYATRFLLFELSTIFLDIHWFLEKLGYGETLLFLLNDACSVLAYFLVRILYGVYLSFTFTKDIYLMRDSITPAHGIASVLANVTTHSLNFYWFSKLVISVLRFIRPNNSKSKQE